MTAAMNLKDGTFIVFEGIDGSGKGTYISRIASEIKKQDIPVLVTAEPSSSTLGIVIREQISSRSPLQKNLGPAFDSYMALLMCADRTEHYFRTILPALKANSVVLCDRFTWSTLAYQDGVFSTQVFDEIADHATPDLTLYFRIPVKEALKRITQNRTTQDVFESEKKLHQVATSYERLVNQALSKGNQVRIVEAGASEDTVFLNAWSFIRNFLSRPSEG